MLKCHVVKQLIPNYVDGLLDDETRRDVDEHLQSCEECRAFCSRAQAEVATDNPVGAGAEPREIAYLAGLKRRTIAIVLAVVLVLAALFGVYMKLFYWGSAVDSTDMLVTQDVVIRQGNEPMLLFDFRLTNGKNLHMGVEYITDETGAQTGVVLTPRAVARNPLDDMTATFQYGYHWSADGEFTITIRYADIQRDYHVNEWV